MNYTYILVKNNQ